MTKRPNHPQRAPRVCPVPRSHSIGASVFSPENRLSRIFVLLVLGLVLGALLASCTRDRPLVEGDVSTVGDGAVPMSDTPIDTTQPAEPAPAPAAGGGGEPEVEVSEITTDTASGTPDPNAITIVEYEVASGDTLLSIALKFDSTTEDLRALNKLNADLIQIGQLLQVPVKPAEPTPTPEPFYHTVQPGESLTQIAAQFGVPWTDIVTANKLPDANALRAGMSLIIPGYNPTASADGTADEGAQASTANVDPQQQATHAVKAGQTLTQIAHMYDIPMGEIQRANNIANASLVKPGQVLVLPGMTVAQALEALSTTHTVAAGESISGIAKQYGVTVAEIVRANNLRSADSIRTGQVLIIPPPTN